MAVWQIRAGGRAQLADAFITEGRVRLGFGLDVSLLEFSSQEAVQEWLNIHAPGEGSRAASSMWQLLHEVQIGDLVVMPSKPGGTEYAIGRITGGYEFEPNLVETEGVPHTRKVEWIKTGIPGERLATLSLPRRFTIARLSGDDTEARIREILD